MAIEEKGKYYLSCFSSKSVLATSSLDLRVRIKKEIIECPHRLTIDGKKFSCSHPDRKNVWPYSAGRPETRLENLCPPAQQAKAEGLFNQIMTNYS